LPPLSIRNEKRVLKKIYDLTSAQLLAYPTTIEQDEEQLKDDSLTFNHRNSILYRLGEKKILIALMIYVDKIMPLLDMDFKSARKIVEKDRNLDECSEYISNCIYYLIKKENVGVEKQATTPAIAK
jgi:hypothetical protein